MSVYNCMRESWSDTQSVPVAGQRWAAVEEEGEPGEAEGVVGGGGQGGGGGGGGGGRGGGGGGEGGLACRGFRYLQI